MPELTPYALAAIRARALAGSLSDRLASQLADDLDIFARTVLAEILSLRNDTPAEQRRAVRASHAVIVRAAELLDSTMATAIAEQRSVAFTEIMDIQREAAKLAAQSEGAAFGAVRIPKLTLEAAYTAGGPRAPLWRTTLTEYIDNAAAELDRLIRTALLQGIRPADLARQLRPYVQGAETFYQAFKGRDEAMQAMRGAWKALPEDLRGAAKTIHYNARRIAESELHTAYGEAVKTNGLADPLVDGYVWTLSPAHLGEDVCDFLAKTDFYGGGPGWYPKTKVPEWPHPFCWCALYPTLRPFSRVNDPLPDTKRITNPATLKIPNAATPRAAQRIREQLGALLDDAEQPLSRAEQALLAHGAATARGWHSLAHAH